MTALYQTLGFDWHGIAVSVACDPDWSKAWREVHGYPLWHLQISSHDGRPLPISETGYVSRFISGAVLDAWGGPEAWVRAWLDSMAGDPAWLELKASGQRLVLF